MSPRSNFAILLSIAGLVLGCCPCCSADRSVFALSQPFGSYAVGFRLVEQYDHSRVFAPRTGPMGEPTTGERDRPVQTLIWYPAAEKSGAPVTLARYLSLAAHQYTFQPTADAEKRKSGDTDSKEGAKEQMRAVENASPAAGSFPLIIYAPAFTSPSFENVDLCEYLASFGFVVIASPSNGAHGGMTGEGLEGVHAQAQDISFLIGFAENLKQVDSSRVAVVGYSWGGLSNFFAAANDDRISALVCIDGSSRYFPKKIGDSKEVSPQKLTLPLLFFTSRNQSLEEIVQDRQDVSISVLNEMVHSDVYIVNMREMAHRDFSAISERIPSGTVDRPASEFTDAETATSYSWMARYTREFLQAELNGDAASLAFLKRPPRENGVPPHLLSVDLRPGSGIPMTVQALAVKARSDGFSRLPQIYADAQKTNGDAHLTVGDLTGWGEQLIGGGHLNEGIEVMRLTISLYPTASWYPYRVLSQAYVSNHQNDLAIATLKELLQKDPQNEFGQVYLKSLETTPKR